MDSLERFIAQVKTRAEIGGRVDGRLEGLAEGEARGRAEGEAKGRLEGRAEGRIAEVKDVLLVFLRERGFRVDHVVRARVLSSRNLGELEHWCKRSATAATIDEVFTQ